MCGVIDRNGQQWERCNRCGKWVKIQKLWYEKPSHKYEYGRDLCERCVEWLDTIDWWIAMCYRMRLRRARAR